MPLPIPSSYSRLGLLAAAALAASAAACTPNIGDSCSLSTDCASDGTRVCDTSQPGGYCTILNCTGSELGSACPEYAICVQFTPAVPGCPVNSQTPSRIGQSFCLEGCASDSDCRAGYWCRYPAGSPWHALILDTNQQALVCMPNLVNIDGGLSPVSNIFDGSLDAIPPVCQASGPTFDAGFPPVPDAGPDAGSDASKKDGGKKDAGKDGGKKDGAADSGKRDSAPDGKVDSTLHDGGGPDAAKDVVPDAPADAPADAPRDAVPG